MSHNFPTSTLREGVMAHNYVIVVPWFARVYGICTLSAVLCIHEGEARGNT